MVSLVGSRGRSTPRRDVVPAADISARLGYDLVAGLQSIDDLDIGAVLDAGLDLGEFHHAVLDFAGGGAFVAGEYCGQRKRYAFSLAHDDFGAAIHAGTRL